MRVVTRGRGRSARVLVVVTRDRGERGAGGGRGRESWTRLLKVKKWSLAVSAGGRFPSRGNVLRCSESVFPHVAIGYF